MRIPLCLEAPAPERTSSVNLGALFNWWALIVLTQAAALALKLRDDNALDGVVGQLLNIPVLCHPRFFPHGDHELQSYQQNARSPTINGERMRWFWGTLSPVTFKCNG